MFMGMPSLQLPQPIGQGNFLAFPPHRQCPCHTCTCIRLRSLSRGHMMPSIRLPLVASSRPRWSPRGMGFGVIDGLGHWQGNVGWSCVCNRSHGSNGYHLEKGGHRRQGNGLEHHPTKKRLASRSEQRPLVKVYLLVPSRILHSCPSYQRIPGIPCS